MKTTFIMDNSKNKPTPIPTTAISTVLFITALTWSASTVKSGSATVISKPITKLTNSSRGNLLVLVSPEPICSPIGVIARSAPRLNSPIPKTRNIAETTNVTISRGVAFTTGVKHIIKTMIVTGTTEISDSLSLESNPLPSIFALNDTSMRF